MSKDPTQPTVIHLRHDRFPQPLLFDQWWDQVCALYQVPDMRSCENWREMWRDGMTPQEAVEEDMRHGI